MAPSLEGWMLSKRRHTDEHKEGGGRRVLLRYDEGRAWTEYLRNKARADESPPFRAQAHQIQAQEEGPAGARHCLVVVMERRVSKVWATWGSWEVSLREDDTKQGGDLI